jgi:hypothetical protein
MTLPLYIRDKLQHRIHRCLTSSVLIIHFSHFIVEGFEGLGAITMKLAVFWNLMPCRLLRVFTHFWGMFYFNLQSRPCTRLQGATSGKTEIRVISVSIPKFGLYVWLPVLLLFVEVWTILPPAKLSLLKSDRVMFLRTNWARYSVRVFFYNWKALTEFTKVSHWNLS